MSFSVIYNVVYIYEGLQGIKNGAPRNASLDQAPGNHYHLMPLIEIYRKPVHKVIFIGMFQFHYIHWHVPGSIKNHDVNFAGSFTYVRKHHPDNKSIIQRFKKRTVNVRQLVCRRITWNHYPLMLLIVIVRKPVQKLIVPGMFQFQ